jgi:hypothetical protein
LSQIFRTVATQKQLKASQNPTVLSDAELLIIIYQHNNGKIIPSGFNKEFQLLNVFKCSDVTPQNGYLNVRNS